MGGVFQFRRDVSRPKAVPPWPYCVLDQTSRREPPFGASHQKTMGMGESQRTSTRLPPPPASGFHVALGTDSSFVQIVDGCGFHWFGEKRTCSNPAAA